MIQRTIADLHTHTVASSHAQSTIIEIMTMASKRKLKAVAITDHAPGISDGAHRWHFGQLTLFPRVIEGVYMLRGVEANIQNPDGALDLDERRMGRLDLVIASLHDDVFVFSTKADLTRVLETVVQNPFVTILGHLGSQKFPFDYERIVALAKDSGALIEINENSFFARKGSEENCKKIALLCKQYQVPVTIDSDAHNAFLVGKVARSVRMLEQIDFPEDLIVNADLARLDAFFRKRKGLDIMGELEAYAENPEAYL